MIGIQTLDFYVNQYIHFPDYIRIKKDEYGTPYKVVFVFNSEYDFVVSLTDTENGIEVVYESMNDKWHKDGIYYGIESIEIDTRTDKIEITENPPIHFRAKDD